MVNTVFIVLLSIFTLYSFWHIYINHYKPSIWQKELYHSIMDPMEVAKKLTEFADSRMWKTKTSSLSNLPEFDIPKSTFFWGGKVTVNIKPKDKGCEAEISRRPVFITSEIQNSILEKKIYELITAVKLVKAE